MLIVNVSRIMIPIREYPVISENASVYSAARTLVEKYRARDGTWPGYEMLLVSDLQKEVVGFVTLRSFLKAVGLSDRENGGSLMETLFSRQRLNNSGLRVKSIMHPLDNRTINVDEDLERLVTIITENRANSVVVIDGDMVVGVVRVIDLLWFVEDLL